jgi:hypothetical protein
MLKLSNMPIDGVTVLCFINGAKVVEKFLGANGCRIGAKYYFEVLRFYAKYFFKRKNHNFAKNI